MRLASFLLCHSLLFLPCFLDKALAAQMGISKSSFTVHRVRNPNFRGRDGPRALAKAYRKFGIPLPMELAGALGARKDDSLSRPSRFLSRRWARSNDGSAHKASDGSLQLLQNIAKEGWGPGIRRSSKPPKKMVGSVVATPERNDAEYLSPVRIGGQTLNLALDTGSADLWVFNTQLSRLDTAGHGIYDPGASKTFSMIKDAQFAIKYGDGSGALGVVGTDSVDVGGVTVQAQAIELATMVSRQFVDDHNNDGILGLAFSRINMVSPDRQMPFFENVMGSLQEPLFTADLRKNASGAFTFGALDATRFCQPLAWIPVDSRQGFWQFASHSFAVGRRPSPVSTPGRQAMVDTGSSLLLADPKIVQAYYARVGGARISRRFGGFIFPCQAEMPDLHLDIGGRYMARVAGDNIKYAQLNNRGETLFSSPWGCLSLQ